jgi:hypothetical protein
LSCSPIAVFVKVAILTTIELILEEFNMPGWDGVNCAQDVPVDESGTGRSGNRPLVDVSVVGVNKLHKVTIRHEIHCWAFFWHVTPFEAVKEVVDYCLFRFREVGCEVLDWEYDSHSGSNEAAFDILGEVNGVHLKIEPLAVDGMLRTWMEMELICAKLIIGTEYLLCNLRGKHVLAISSIEVHLIGETIKFRVGFQLVWIGFGEHVCVLVVDFVIEVSGVFRNEIDWRLVCRAAKVVRDCIIKRPVFTVFGKIPHTFWGDGGCA